MDDLRKANEVTQPRPLQQLLARCIAVAAIPGKFDTRIRPVIRALHMRHLDQHRQTPAVDGTFDASAWGSLRGPRPFIACALGRMDKLPCHGRMP